MALIDAAEYEGYSDQMRIGCALQMQSLNLHFGTLTDLLWLMMKNLN